MVWQKGVIILVLLAVCSLQSPTTGADFSTQAGAENFIENFALSSLPEPIGDVVTVVMDSPAIVKEGLRGWLRAKMADSAEDAEKFDRYNAFYTCLNGDCDALRALEKNTSIPESQQGQEVTEPTSGKLAANGTNYQKGALLVGPISLPAEWTDPQDVLFLDQGRPYIIVGDGTCSLWDGQNDGCDSVYRYRTPLEPNGGEIKIWGQLELVNPSIHLSDLIEKNTGNPAEYNPSHIYEAVVIGEGKTLKARVFDGGGYSDNHGELKISVYQAIEST